MVVGRPKGTPKYDKKLKKDNKNFYAYHLANCKDPDIKEAVKEHKSTPKLAGKLKKNI